MLLLHIRKNSRRIDAGRYSRFDFTEISRKRQVGNLLGLMSSLFSSTHSPIPPFPLAPLEPCSAGGGGLHLPIRGERGPVLGKIAGADLRFSVHLLETPGGLGESVSKYSPWG
ncbi:MAG TPA: hypothetical protein DDZ83_03890, partial [Nitrospinae bacterium]|nr:hypothetical protein [Nitrospinota bacterium]